MKKRFGNVQSILRNVAVVEYVRFVSETSSLLFAPTAPTPVLAHVAQPLVLPPHLPPSLASQLRRPGIYQVSALSVEFLILSKANLRSDDPDPSRFHFSDRNLRI
ncbi:hypothetical protein REPUB_Repub08aG0224700 [Reevesia pubescens]